MRKFLQIVGFAPVFLLSQPVYATDLDIYPRPLFLGGAVDPNIMLLFDDSGSMQLESLPDDGYTHHLYPIPSSEGMYGTDSYHEKAVPAFNGELDGEEQEGGQGSYGVWIRSSHVNKLYYNPAITYTPWVEANGQVVMTPADKICAWHNPRNNTIPDGEDPADYCRNLTMEKTQAATWAFFTGSMSGLTDVESLPTEVEGSQTFWPAVYYQYKSSTCSSDPDDDVDKWRADCYDKIEIKSAADGGSDSYTGGTDRTDCASAPTCTYAEEIQNFANWYTYYRSRILLARNGIGKAFAAQSTGLRVGFGALNKGPEEIDGFSSDGALVKGLRQFSGTDRTAFFQTLYDYPIEKGATPSRKALDLVGQYFEWDDDRGPWGNSPGPADGAEGDNLAHLECRQSFTVLMTDGYWSDTVSRGVHIDVADTEEARANVDNEDGPTISDPDGRTYQYSPSSPYRDDSASTLADVAMYYWNRDLRPGLANKVPTNTRDEAFWQHMVTYAVGLGVSGTLGPEDLAGLIAGTTPWPSVGGDEDLEETKVDDLWHAAVNSRGDYFSAANPTEFAEQLEATLSSISQRVASAAAIATNSTRLNSSTFVYQAKFDPVDWHGKFLAYQIDPYDGEVSTTPAWDASEGIPAADSRNILSYDPDSEEGVLFEWGEGGLSDDQKALLDPDSDGLGEERLAWLRGDASNEERNSGLFRSRTNGVLGDIVNSDPWRVAEDNYGYNILPGDEGSGYVAYRNSTAYKTRSKVIYVGANDGMLHAFDAGTWNSSLNADGDGTAEGGFDAGTGREKFAFVPNTVLANLHELTDPDYSHSYFVDGPSRASDAYIGGAWKTVLVGTLGAGGKGVFALDVTDPDNMDETKVLWELTDATDLGFTMGQPAIARMYPEDDGPWVAIFGNGYNSASGKAVLFIVDLATGSVIEKLDTESGDSSNKNGLSTPTAIDNNNDGIVDAIYAGDLFGNLWKFDVSANNDNQWGSAYTSGGNPEPLFTAIGPDSTPQPITAKVDVGSHPAGGEMVYFGTGKYIERTDNESDDVQSLYGIWDDGAAVSYVDGRDDALQEQQILIEETLKDADGELDFNIRITSSNKVCYVNTDPGCEDVEDVDLKSGWYMDLETPDADMTGIVDGEISVSNWVAKGERVISAPILHDGRVLFTTLIPEENPCDYGGTSWTMDLTAIDGSQPSVSTFDFNNDGIFDADDYHLWDQGDESPDNDLKLVVSGKQSKVGITKTPAVIRVGDREYRYAGGSEGGIEKTTGARSTKTGRQSWWQIR